MPDIPIQTLIFVKLPMISVSQTNIEKLSRRCKLIFLFFLMVSFDQSSTPNTINSSHTTSKTITKLRRISREWFCNCCRQRWQNIGWSSTICFAQHQIKGIVSWDFKVNYKYWSKFDDLCIFVNRPNNIHRRFRWDFLLMKLWTVRFLLIGQFFQWIYSGGPLIRGSDGAVVGVTSFTQKFHQNQAFTNVHYHNSWITNVTGINLPNCSQFSSASELSTPKIMSIICIVIVFVLNTQ